MPATGDVATRTCNGSTLLCDRRYNEVVFAAAHNAMSNADDAWVAPNQIHGIEQQLDSGIRALLIDTHRDHGRLLLCHGLCALGERDLVDAFAAIAAFLRADRGAVVTLLIEDGITDAETLSALRDAGLFEFSWEHPGGQTWPTLGQMVSSNHRLVVFAENGGAATGSILHMWDFVSDTPWAHESAAALRHDCSLARGDAANGLFLLNHWLYDIPDPATAQQVNYRPFLDGRARECRSVRRLPNFIAVNFVSLSDVVDVAAELNGLPPD